MKLYLSIITDKEGSAVHVLPFESEKDAVKYNALVGIKMAREGSEEEDEDEDELIQNLELCLDNEDFEEFQSNIDDSYIGDKWSFTVSEHESVAEGYQIPEGEMPSWQ